MTNAINRAYRHRYAPLVAFLLIVALFATFAWRVEQHQTQLEATQDRLVEAERRSSDNAQARVEAFCKTEHDMRLIMADTLTIIAADPEDTTLTARERRDRIAGNVEVRLKEGLPEICGQYVNLDDIEIQTNGVMP